MSSKVAALSRALKGPEAEPVAAAPIERANSQAAPSRANKAHISAWLDKAFKTSLRMVQVKQPDKNLQDLYEEALNDLFQKYDVPVIRKD